jgi:geranylgeranyl diphosphate synthase, type II
VKRVYELLEIIERNLSEYRQNNTFCPVELYDPVFYTLGHGGKRIRPVLVLMGLNLFDESIDDGIASALAVEIFHNFTLLHDDIMDNSSQRRSLPTVHKKWGINTAILSGDAMTIMAYRFLAQSPQKHLSSLMNVFNKAALEVCEGQQLDINFEANSSVQEKDYLEMIRLKTSVLLAASLQMGAILGEADQADQLNLYQFGLNLGLAFQLQDDYLDTFGDQSVFGKRIGNDILTNKKTFLLVKALEISKGETREKLLNWLDLKDYDETEKIMQVTEIYNCLSLAELTKEEISHFNQSSLNYLSLVKVQDDRKALLVHLAEQLITRDK